MCFPRTYDLPTIYNHLHLQSTLFTMKSVSDSENEWSGTSWEEEDGIVFRWVSRSKRNIEAAHSTQSEEKLEKKERRRRRQDEGLEKQIPPTLESLRKPDARTAVNVQCDPEEDAENTLLNNYFKKETKPKILIMYNDLDPATKTQTFVRELTRVIPNSVEMLPRKMQKSSMKEIMLSAIKKKYTDVVIVDGKSSREPSSMMLSHLPEGPTAHFSIYDVEIDKELEQNRKEIENHRPEVILKNFSTRLGIIVSRMLAAIFVSKPEGRRAVTFENVRDNIFFRHHRYEFKKGERVATQEIGPQFTLRLRSLQFTTFDQYDYADHEWIIDGRRHENIGKLFL